MSLSFYRRPQHGMESDKVYICNTTGSIKDARGGSSSGVSSSRGDSTHYQLWSGYGPLCNS
jgi:hypothetical protein